MNRILAFLLLVPAAAFAGQAVTFNNTNQWASRGLGSGYSPATADAVRIEMRVSGLVTGGPIQYFISGNNGPRCYVAAAATAVTCTVQGSNSPIAMSLGSARDFRLRYQKTLTTVSLELWAANGSPIGTTSSSGSFATYSMANDSIRMGSNGTAPTAFNGQLDFVRWYSTTIATGSRPPADVPDAYGDLLDYEFEGTGSMVLSDLSGRGLSLVWNSGSPSVLALSYSAPFVSFGSTTTYRAGVPIVLDAASGSFVSTGNGVPQNFKFRQTAGPTDLLWSSRTSGQPTVTGTTFGQYSISVSITDALGQNTDATVTFGAVATDSKGIIKPADDFVDQLLGPNMRYGANPWPLADEKQKSSIDYLLPLIINGGLSKFVQQWNTPLPGTLSVTNGSKTVTGSPETNFQVDFCGGGTTPVTTGTGGYMVVWYSTGGSPAVGRMRVPIQTCNSANSITLETNYAEMSESGIQYSKWTDGSSGTSSVEGWAGGGDNVNYYDVDFATYNLYFRTGLDVYKNYADSLANLWIQQPGWDYGRAWNSVARRNVGTNTAAPRTMAFTGLALNTYLSGNPIDKLQALRRYEDQWTWYIQGPGPRTGCNNFFTNITHVGSIREEAYMLWFCAVRLMHEKKLNALGHANAEPSRIAPLETTMATAVTKYNSFLQPAYDPLNTSGRAQNYVLNPGGMFVESSQSLGYGTVSEITSTYIKFSVAPPAPAGNPASMWVWRGNAFPAGNTGTAGVDVDPVVYFDMINWFSQALTAPGTTITINHGFDADQAPYLSVACFNSNDTANGASKTVTYPTATTAQIVFGSSQATGVYCKVSSPRQFFFNTTQSLTPTSYQGTPCNPCTNTYAHRSNIVGWGTQPFMQGLGINTFRIVDSAVGGNATAQEMAKSLARWLSNRDGNGGYNPVDRSIHYGRGWMNCESSALMPNLGTLTNFNCYKGMSGRFGNGEMSSGLGYAYSLLPDGAEKTQTKSTLDEMYSAVFTSSTRGGPNDAPAWDGNDVDEILTLGTDNKPKNIGFFYGAGFSQMWPAIRAGGRDATVTRTIKLGISIPATATKAVVTVTDPRGVATSTTCTSSPCSVTTDSTLGNPIVKIEYKTAGDAVVGKVGPFSPRV